MLSKLSYLAGVGCWPGGEGAGKNDGTIEKKIRDKVKIYCMIR